MVLKLRSALAPPTDAPSWSCWLSVIIINQYLIPISGGWHHCMGIPHYVYLPVDGHWVISISYILWIVLLLFSFLPEGHYLILCSVGLLLLLNSLNMSFHSLLTIFLLLLFTLFLTVNDLPIDMCKCGSLYLKSICIFLSFMNL